MIYYHFMFLIIESNFFLPSSFQNIEPFTEFLVLGGAGGCKTLYFILYSSFVLGGLNTIVSWR